MADDSFQAFRATAGDGEVKCELVSMSLDDLPRDGVLVKVRYSSVNYKDGLAVSPNGRVARISPLVPGIDLAGTVVEGDGSLREGTEVLAHGYDIGVGRHGGYAGLARIPSDWVVRLPDGLSLREAMVVGTAGFTAALSVLRLEEAGCRPGDGPVLVTGASGGVGSMAVAILAARGYQVTASTGKPEAEKFLVSLGAAGVISRAELQGQGKPLQSTDWAAAVDCVGGETLANVLARISYGGAVAASGLTGGAALSTTVMPFILRGVSLLGVDSVQTPMARRKEVWDRVAGDLKPPALASIGHDVALTGVGEALGEVLAGKITGRAVVDLEP